MKIFENCTYFGCFSVYWYWELSRLFFSNFSFAEQLPFLRYIKTSLSWVLALPDGRSDSYFDVKFLAEHGERILEDLVISLADVIASIYLELMSVDGDMSTEVVSSSLVLCSLSTRELQKLRNEVTIVFFQFFGILFFFSWLNVPRFKSPQINDKFFYEF